MQFLGQRVRHGLAGGFLLGLVLEQAELADQVAQQPADVVLDVIVEGTEGFARVAAKHPGQCFGLDDPPIGRILRGIGLGAAVIVAQQGLRDVRRVWS